MEISSKCVSIEVSDTIPFRYGIFYVIENSYHIKKRSAEDAHLAEKYFIATQYRSGRGESRLRDSLLCDRKARKMETRIAVMGIIVENMDSVEKLNSLLHEYGKYIIGRMGIPYRNCGINIVSIAIDAPQDVIAALAGKIGNLAGISVKTAYSNVVIKNGEPNEK